MADYVTVANLALGKIGEAYRITDPADNTAPARAIAAAWNVARRAALRQGKFNFATTRAELAAQAPGDPNYRLPYPYANRFPVPADLIRLIEVLAPAEAVEDYQFESQAVLSDSDGPLFVRYLRDVVAVGDWDDLFVEAFAALLAFEIADTITGDPARKSACFAEYQKNLRDTGGADARENPPQAPYDSSWVTARDAAGFGGPPNV